MVTRTQKRKIKDWIESLPEIFWICRESHDRVMSHNFGISKKYYGRRWTCRRCGYSYDQIVHNGFIVWTGNRHYPTDYLKPPDLKGIEVNKAEFRRLVHEMLDETEIPEDFKLAI